MATQINKALGRDILRFMDEGFAEEEYYEDAEIDVHDEEGGVILSLDVEHPLSKFGYIVVNSEGKTVSFKKRFNDWWAAQTLANIVIEVKKEDREAIVAKLTEQGYKIV
jgi:hypothetical protein